ncbi:MAG TPA: response regulator [Kofleriaceae bacterium]|nr:response regulator [Kofleriaceae bacterium]
MVAPMVAGAGTGSGTGTVPSRIAQKLSVLVVDDDQDIREYLQDFLNAEGFEVTTLADPAAVVERIRDEVFHLVVLDLMMPKISGLDLLAQIRSVDDDIAVIILTGYPSLETASASIQHEVSAYIHKPFEAAEFRDVIARIAKKKGLVLRREDELHAAIGRQIRDLRKNRQLTLKQMARRTNLSVSLLSQIERAESSASVSSLFKVATALDVPLTDLFAGY